MPGELSRRLARWKYSTGEDAGYLQLDEKTLEALLQLDFDYMFLMRSVDGRIWSVSFGVHGSASEIPFFKNVYSNLMGKNHERQNLAGSFSGALSSTYWAHPLVDNRFDQIINSGGLWFVRIIEKLAICWNIRVSSNTSRKAVKILKCGQSAGKIYVYRIVVV